MDRFGSFNASIQVIGKLMRCQERILRIQIKFFLQTSASHPQLLRSHGDCDFFFMGDAMQAGVIKYLGDLDDHVLLLPFWLMYER